MTAQSAHNWALHRWRTLLDQARAAKLYASFWLDEDALLGMSVRSAQQDGPAFTEGEIAFIAALGPDRVIVLCGQAIARLTAHAPFYDFGKWCRPCDLAQPCPEVRAWTAWWAGEDDYPEELKT